MDKLASGHIPQRIGVVFVAFTALAFAHGCKKDCPGGYAERGGYCQVASGVATAGESAGSTAGASAGQSAGNGAETGGTGIVGSSNEPPHAGSTGGMPANEPGDKAAGEPDAGTHTAAIGGRGGEPGNADPNHAAVCGNGMVEGDEKCDGDCPTEADCPMQKDLCTTNVIKGDAKQCDATCGTTTITECKPNDGCCAEGCNYGNDSDCSKSCGDGVVSPPETCDGDCPASASDCDDGDPCTEDKLIGTPSKCNAKCSSEMSSNACASVPSGWTLGVLVNANCPTGFSNPQSLKSGLSVECSDSCSCSSAAKGTCVGTATVAMTTKGANACPSTQSFQVDQVSPPSTMPLTCYGTVDSVSVDPMMWKCGATDSCPSCTPSGTSQPSVNWASQRTFCAATSPLQCKNGDVCVDSSSSSRLCVMTEGTRACPSGFPAIQGTFYTGASGTPACTCGGCGSNSGTCDQAVYQFNQAGMSLATITSGGGSRTITSDTLEFRASITGAATAASCKDPRATQTANVSGSGAMTVCCAP